MKKLYVFILFSFLSIPPVYPEDVTQKSNSDYDLVCHYFDQLQDVLSKDKLTFSERGQFITDRVNKNLKPDSDARALWNVIIYAVPDERYEMFKTTAEEQTNKPWDCTSMKNLAQTAGE